MLTVVRMESVLFCLKKTSIRGCSCNIISKSDSNMISKYVGNLEIYRKQDAINFSSVSVESRTSTGVVT